jgi:phosphoglycerate dehydrogenase-like enzyme
MGHAGVLVFAEASTLASKTQRLSEAGVPMAITFGANAGAVSEHVLMLMLATYRRFALADRNLRDGVWLRPQLRAKCLPAFSGKTVGARLRQRGARLLRDGGLVERHIPPPVAHYRDVGFK